MNNPIRRVYKPTIKSRHVNLSMPDAVSVSFSANCVVTEYEGVEGWEQWSDTVFVQDFEASILTAPVPLQMEAAPAIAAANAPFEPFMGSGWN